MGASKSESNTEPRHQIVWFDVPCVDLDRGIRFYSAVLGCTIERQDFGGMGMGVLPHQGTSIGGCLVAFEHAKPSDQGILVYFNCEGRLEQAVSEAKRLGGEVLEPVQTIGPHGYRAIIKDSEGNRVALHSMSGPKQ